MTKITKMLLVAGILATATIHGQTWVGGSGVWSNPANWCGGLPNGGDVLIGACKSMPPSNVTEDISATIGNLTIDNSGNSLTVVYPNRLTINGSSISNAGTLAMAGNNIPSQGAQMQLTGTTVTLSGGGTFLMNDSPNLILGGNSSTTLVNQETVSGAGTLGGEGFFNLNNQALVDAQGTNPLNVQNTFGTMLNTGTLQASKGGTLQFNLAGNPGTLNNTGGTIQALDKSTVRLASNTFISNGTLKTAGSGLIHGVNGGLANLTNAGIFQIGGFTGFGSAGIHLGGTIANTGTIRIGSPAWGDDGTLIDGAVTLTGGGTVNFANSTEQMIGANNGGNSLTNTNNTISGTGIMGGGNGLTLTNSGTVDANASTPLVLGLSVTNSSTMQASNGGELRTQGDINNTGGTIQALDKSKVTLVSNTITGGTFATSGTGVIQTAPTQPLLDNVTNTGLLSVPSGAQVAFKDAITNSGTISTDGAGNFIISGAVTLAGHGKVALSNNANNFISGGGGSPSWSNVDNLIEGAGSIAVSLTNQLKGTVLANVSNPLNLQGSPITNLGTFQANKRSVLIILGGTNFTNFSGNTLTGGTFIVAGTFQFPGANIVTNAANILLTSATWKILNSNNNANALANLASNTPAGSLSLSGKAVLTTASTFADAGKVTIAKSSKFTVGGAYTKTGGTTQVDGPGALSSAGTIAAPAFVLNGGTLQGAGGFVNAPVTSGAVVIAGDSKTKTGILNVSAYTQTSSGVLSVQVKASPGNTCAGPGTNYSQLAVQNGSALDGTLTINLLHRPQLNSGDCFNIVTGLTRTGQFATVKVVGGTQTFNVSYLPTGVQLIVP